MQLQSACGDRGCDGALDGVPDCLGFTGTCSEQKDRLAFEDGLDPHGQGRVRDIVDATEVASVVLACSFGQRFDAGA